MLFNCPNPGFFLAENYTVLGEFDLQNLWLLFEDFPGLRRGLQEFIFKLDYPHKRTFFDSLMQLDIFKDQDLEVMHSLLFNMETEKHFKDRRLISRGDNLNKMFFVAKGSINVKV